MSDKKPTVIYSTARLIELRAQVNAILEREKTGRAHLVPSTQQLVAMADLADRALQSMKEGEPVNDALLHTVGSLHKRNKALTKGHATLTRRVQELEAELAAEKDRGIPLMTPRGMKTYNSKGVLQAVIGAMEEIKSPNITHADVQLQADIEALTQRVADLEFATSPGYFTPHTLTDGELKRVNAFNEAVKQLIETEIDKSLRIGGAINRAIR